MELVDWKIIIPPTVLRGIPYEVERIPRVLAPSIPSWARLVLRPRLRSPDIDDPATWAPSFVSPRLIGASDAAVLPHVPTIFGGQFRKHPRRAWKIRAGHRYFQLNILYAVFPPRAKRLERILLRAIEMEAAARRATAVMPPPQTKAADPDRHRRLAAAAYAVIAHDHGHRVGSVEPGLVICPRPDMERLARRRGMTFRDRRWQRLVEREMVVDLARHVDEHGRVRVPKAPPRAWHADAWVNRHVGILIGQDRYEVLQRLTVKTERLVTRRWNAIEAIADRLAERPRLPGAVVRRIGGRSRTQVSNASSR